MKSKLLVLIALVTFSQVLFSQTTQDTINTPYWQEMMFDHSNNYNDIVRAYDLYFSNKTKAKGTGYKQFERWADRWKGKINSDGTFKSDDHIIKEIKKFKLNNLNTRSTSGAWTNLGPNKNPTPSTMMRGVGRINGVGYHPTNSNIIYAGAPQGGFWRSTDKGQNWISSTDNLPTLGVSDIAVIPTGGANPLILIGTGDRDAGNANGLGIYKSTDGGVTFTASTSGFGNGTVNMLAVNPDNDNTIFAATSKGIYASYNQGTSWVKKSTISGNHKDIKYCPNDTNTIYATRGGNFYRSTNAGGNWNQVTTGLNSTTRNRIVIGVTADNPNIVYLLASRSNNNQLEAFYKSSNKGANFTAQVTTTPNILGGRISGNDNRGQGWYDLAIVVSPTDSNEVLVGGINIFKTTNGGTTWTASASWYGESNTPFVHADIHYLGTNPLTNELYVGSDGGVDISTNFGTSYTSINNGLAISQFYNLGATQLSKTKFITGAQDNGTSVSTSATTWTAEVGGDGMQCEISNFNTSHMVASVQYGALRRTTNNGGNWSSITGTISETPGQWVVPYHLHPKVNNILVAVYDNVWLSKNVFGGTPTFSKISTGLASGTQNYGSAVRFSNKNDSLVFFGWNDGTIRYSDNIFDATPTVTAVTTPPGGTDDVRDIETSYTDENILYICKGNNVYKSTNKGTSWTDISTGLPNIAMYSIVLDRNSNEGLYVGTDAGVYYKDATPTTNWTLFNTGLPLNSEIRDLEIVNDTICSSESKIVAATYGRGLWIGDLYISEQEPKININIPSGACATVAVPLINNSTQTNASTEWEWTVTPSAGVTYTSGTNNTSISPVLSIANPGTYSIKVKATNPNNGFCTKTYTNAIIIGSVGNMQFLNGLDGDTILCPNDTLLVSVTGMDNYTWEVLPEMLPVNDSTIKIFPSGIRTYRVFGDINNACFDTLEYSANMKDIPLYTINKPLDDKICVGTTGTYTFTGIDSSVWSPPLEDLDTPVGNVINISPTVTNIYNVILKKDGKCDVKLNIRVKALLNPSPNYTKHPDTVICNIDTSYMTELNIPSKVFMPNTNLTWQSNFSIKLHPNQTTTYYLTTSDTNYCPRNYDTINITVKDLPQIKVSGRNEVCIGDSVLITASGANAYQWTPNIFLNSNTSSSVWSKPTSDSIIYTIVGTSNNCTSSITHKVRVGKDPVNLEVEGARIICDEKFTDLVASGANNYTWSPKELVHNQFSDRVRVQTQNSTTLRLIGKNTGCSDTMDIPISVVPRPTVTLSSSTSPICQGDSTIITASGASTYFISPNFNTIQNQNVFTVFPNASRGYKVFGIDNNNCQSKDSVFIEINPLPVLNISPKSSTLDYGDSITIFAIGADNIEWSPKKFITDSSQNDRITVKPTEDIIYKIKGTKKGCESEGIAIVYVLQNGPDSTDSTDSTGSSINQANIANILVYPNPSSRIFNVESSNEAVNYNLYNYLGETVLSNKELMKNHKVVVETLPKGTYMLELTNKNNNSRYLRVQVK